MVRLVKLVGHMLAVLGDRLDGPSPTDIRQRKKEKVRPAPGSGPVRFTTAFDPAPTVPTGSDPFLPREEGEYEYEMDMDSVEDEMYPARRIKDQGGPGEMQGQTLMVKAPEKMTGDMQMNPQMIAKLMQMMKKRKGAM